MEELARRGDERLALAGDALEVCVVARDDDAIAALEALMIALREASARTRVRALGRDEGYRIEDASELVLAVPADGARLAAWLERRLGKRVAVIERAGPFALAARLAARVGRSPERVRYAATKGSGRVHVEAFELHVAEHCNLKCANCCNMSPLVAERMLSVADVEGLVTRMASALHADVIKIMGGEPLLHPELPEILRVLRASGIADRVRLFTNGLLLAGMADDFWEALDELTISNYTSAPVKPAILAMVRARSRRHDFVLNVKPVDEFTQVLSPRYQADDAAVAQTFQRCWLRHRCLVVRDRRFYMCTRAAYADDFLHRVEHEAPPVPLDRSGDGISIDAPELAAVLASYLDRDEPLGACRYCFGGDGRSEPHYQLTRSEVARGVLSRRLQLAR